MVQTIDKEGLTGNRMIPKDSNQVSDEQLMQGYVLSRNTEYYTLLYNRYFTVLSKYLYWLCGDMEKSKDIAQNIFVKLYTRPELFDQSGNFKVWLFSIAKNNWKNDLRSSSSQLKLRNSLAQLTPHKEDLEEIELDQGNAKRKIENAMMKLSEKHREVITLKYSSNLSIQEMAEVLNCSSGTIKSRLFYALTKMKKLM